jgi:hypothetical protein
MRAKYETQIEETKKALEDAKTKAEEMRKSALE